MGAVDGTVVWFEDCKGSAGGPDVGEDGITEGHEVAGGTRINDGLDWGAYCCGCGLQCMLLGCHCCHRDRCPWILLLSLWVEDLFLAGLTVDPGIATEHVVEGGTVVVAFELHSAVFTRVAPAAFVDKGAVGPAIHRCASLGGTVLLVAVFG